MPLLRPVFVATSLLLAGTLPLKGEIAGLSAAQPANPAGPVAALPPARLLTIAPDAFAGSSINVVAGLQHTLFTDRGHQFAAFYAADGTLMLARRALDTEEWTLRRTPYRADVNDAHNTVALVADGDGFLHVSWGHHNVPLNYARSLATGSLELGPREPMTGQLEDRVTYPQFLRLPDGDLLFFHRDGRSGRGNFVLSRYAARDRTWRRVHAGLIDGEGRRSAYTAVTVDAAGVLHLAWNWRDSPDVATNHDLAYARSADGGVTWAAVDGRPLSVPFTAANADYALRLPAGRSLMNPPSLGVDAAGRPILANYWCPEGSDVPQYHAVRHDGSAWRVLPVTRRTTPFALSGMGTRRPLLSRSVVLPVRAADGTQQLHLAYRDDERGGRIVLASCPDLDAADPAWTFRALTAGPVGAWEPSLDPVQLADRRQFHLLVQRVEQRDGNDRQAAAVPPAPIGVLVLDPAALPFSPSPQPAAPGGR